MQTNPYTKVSSYEGKIGEIKKVVLLYSGGLDTSCMLKWIKDTYKAEIVTLTLDLGQQNDDLDAIKKKAIKLGAQKAYVIDAKDEFADDYLTPLIKANGSYQGDYHISTVSRYLMAKLAVVVAYKEGAEAVAHGCTGKGNDQVRIDSAVMALDSKMKVIAPVREWDMSRDEEILYAKKNGIPTPIKIDFPYSDDDNMWGMTWEGGEIEDPKFIPKIEKFQRASNLIKNTPSKPELVTLQFQKGTPNSLNGKKLKLSELIMKLNKIAGRHGVGVVHHLEDRLVGLKNRGVYEHPGAHTIIEAHRNLEKYVCTRAENELKEMLDIKWAYLCYGAQWFDPVMADIDAFNEKINEKVTGKVTIRLFKGGATVVAMTSPYGLHHASFNKGGTFYNIQTSAPFIEVYSMQARLSAQRAEKTALVTIGEERNKKKFLGSARKLNELGFQLFATDETHSYLMKNNVPSLLVHKISGNGHVKPTVKDVLSERGFDLIVNIAHKNPSKQEAEDGSFIRKYAIDSHTLLCTQPDTAEHVIDRIYRSKFGNMGSV